jgi:flagellar basal body-associated protein FliL
MTSKEDDRKPTDEERGWEDWDEDSRRALGKSHERTMGTLEDASIVSTVTRSPRTSPPNTRDPKDQILPSDLELNLQEQEAKRRMSIDDSSISKERKRVFTRRCMIIATVVLVCVCSVAVGTALLPSGALGGKTVVKVTGDVEETAANIGRAVTAYVRSAANFIGNEVKPAQDEKDSDGLGFLLPDYAFASLVEKLKIEGYQMPDYTGLYSSTREPVIDVQPVLWMTERSGSKSLKDILTYCARLVLSGDAAIGHETADVS